MNDNNNIKAGDLVQIWDYQFESSPIPQGITVRDHGSVGYIVAFESYKNEKYQPAKDGKICKIICFGDDATAGKIVYINRTWVRKLESSSDILTPSPLER